MTTKKQVKVTGFLMLVFKKTLLMAIFGLTLIMLLIACFYLAYYQKIYPSTSLAGVDLSGLSQKEALNKMEAGLANQQNEELVFSYNDSTISAKISALEVDYQLPANIFTAYRLGRSGGFWQNLQTQTKLLVKKEALKLEVKYNQNALKNILSPLSGQIYKAVINPSINIVDNFGIKTIKVNPGENGQDIDWQSLDQNLRHNLGYLKKQKINVSSHQIKVSISSEQVQTSKNRAEKMINKIIRLNFENNQWEIDDNKMIGFISYSEKYDKNKVASYSVYLAKSTDRPAQNALFVYENSQVKEFKPAKEGIILDQHKSTQMLVASLEKMENTIQSEDQISLPVIVSQAKISTADSNSFGINSLLAKGESWYYHSIPSRIHNLDLASSKFHGILIPPGEELSFNQTVGDISMQSGYQQAYIIKNGRTILGDGGGVCQVSTTLFRAALNAGLEIVSRTGHAYRVSYYEYNSPVGQDATVFDPQPDLIIKNNTDHHILIQKVIDKSNYYLSFLIYGAPDGRQVYISQSRIWDQAPPPPDLYQEDPTLPAGTVKQIDWAAWGAKTAFDYKVSKGNDILQEKTFYTNYRPWQAIYLQGSKTD